jgi:threonine dehydratase
LSACCARGSDLLKGGFAPFAIVTAIYFADTNGYMTGLEVQQPRLSMAEIEWLTLILEARRRIAPYLRPTPLYYYPLLSSLSGAKVYVKHENFQPIGAFKVRGGINLIASLSAEEKQRGVITASSGNHGQSVAYAAHLFGVKAIIGVPENCNPAKLAAMESWGAEILLHGRDFDEAREKVEKVASERGMRYIHPANEPLLIAGVATIALEVLEDLPQADFLFCAIGGGSSCSGALLVARSLKPSLRVIGVQAAQASSAYESWKQRKLVSTGSSSTFAEGVQTRVAFEMTQAILQENLRDFILVEEEEMRQAILHYLEKARTLAEGAGAAPLAAALKCRDQIQGKNVVLYLSGGNESRSTLTRALTDPDPW